MASIEERKLPHQEKRLAPRTPMSIAVNYAAQGEAYEDFVQDISAGGIFIETQIHFVLGQPLAITLPLPGHQHFIQVTGEVVRQTPLGIGVRFNKTIRELLAEPEFPGF